MRRILFMLLLKQLVLFPLLQTSSSSAVKVVELGSRLPELIKIHSEKNWLIKFYAPWCHYCKQLEPTYHVVAEKLYQKYDNLIVGKVDCTSNRDICSEYGIDSFPTISFINKETNLKYNHEREVGAIVSFADRLMAPDISYISTCNELEHKRDEHGMIIVGNQLNQSKELFKHLKSLIIEYKFTWWFYFLRKSCKNLVDRPGIYILKSGLRRATRFDDSKTNVNKENLREWIETESFSIYSRLSWMNYEKFLKTGKLIVVAYLDEYKPTRKLFALSKKYSKLFADFAERYLNENDESVLFAWSSDFELMSMLTMTSLKAPNVVFLRSDNSYYIAQKETPELSDSDPLPANLTTDNIEQLVNAAKKGDLKFSGGNSFIDGASRNIYRNILKIRLMYESQPLLFLVLIIPPILIVMFVVYSTCYNPKEDDESCELSSDDDDEADEKVSSVKPLLKSGKKLKKS